MWFALFSIIFYILSLLLIAPFLMNSSEEKLSQSKIPFFLTALAAIVLHAASTFPLLEDLASGQTFRLMEIASLMSVIIAALATLSMFLVSTMWFVLPIVYAFSIISLIFATFLSSHIIQMLNQNTLMLFHIGLSLFTYAVCFIATLYVIQLVWLDRNLKKRKIQFSPAIPPLMAVERHFFCLFAMGEVLLTLTLISGTYHVLQAVTLENLHKAIFSFLAWISFGIACFGHWRLGWRGKRMIIYAISGIILLTIAYFGSRLI
ncbi:MAG: cytochrome c biogenesis protein CcsA [Haemophilus parainfluenzae]|jgi:predicted inner membrane protein|uniref:cytochrome C assembly family protein n=1 Tax=Haemophilus parainfluenzae TaxID=729 RepID=UPI000DAC6FCB|nr:cytochrome c biogenesis protein CcsA [Haemophilus parainfluenzae]MDU2562182.1 cytochrome c biogenesis protein CcsA [Haemophilus parainfluenzae]MDU4440019.1 cytochrome c biogenesis protein CcsA [Haemophilus parainfluenzae]MDU4496966.1 cytochrome c biogenesis protein CcsA [Haemophilus parainfluenzae]MDU5697272.1 cytochrome c biogenesis protein CcsA [Haemophilus parainfluenzae]RDE74419.1 inner membrane protein YpjD [Haemophilus parainfluenzae]